MIAAATLWALLSGGIVMGFIVAGTFFARFYQRSRDRLFLAFAVSFWLQALQRLVLGVVERGSENELYAFMLRLLAYVVLLVAIIDRNRHGTPERSRP